MSTSRIHDLAERFASLFRQSFRESASESGLNLVQLEALVYFDNANRYSDTAASLTEYLALTKGTVSQTIKALERRGLLTKVVDASDARVQHCALTEAGQTIARRARPAELLRGLEDSATHTDALEALLRALQRQNQHRSFGVCKSCRHFGRRSRGGRCGLTGEALSIGDSGRMCREHEHADEAEV